MTKPQKKFITKTQVQPFEKLVHTFENTASGKNRRIFGQTTISDFILKAIRKNHAANVVNFLLPLLHSKKTCHWQQKILRKVTGRLRKRHEVKQNLSQPLTEKNNNLTPGELLSNNWRVAGFVRKWVPFREASLT